ncbi:MAG: hypothetical protein KDA22_03310 [Phycisphaerales bacterium]|nr:hypothetical protein [Phycisphaerales bacterium]
MNTAGSPMSGNRGGDDRRIQLVKNAQRWTFAVAQGEEECLHQALVELVAASGGALDWFDAAVVCLELEARRVR